MIGYQRNNKENRRERLDQSTRYVEEVVNEKKIIVIQGEKSPKNLEWLCQEA